MSSQNPSIAFYAPMKSPDHPKPSGDRLLAQNILQALRHNPGQIKIELISQFRSYEGKGNKDKQIRLERAAHEELKRIRQQFENKKLRAWVTYHNYYKAPDLLGPVIADTCSIPYILIEATRARKRLNGPWSRFAELAEKASDRADTIFYFTHNDKEALEKFSIKGQNIKPLAPFLNCQNLPRTAPRSKRSRQLLCVAMMRPGDKLASYQFLANTLSYLKGDWTLNIIGDGEARGEVENAFKQFGQRIQFLGQLTPLQIESHYEMADLFVWPGFNEAFGMVYLEAQSFGLPVIAEDRPGVREVIAPDGYLVPNNQPKLYANTIEQALDASDTKFESIRKFVKNNHLLPKAASMLWTEIDALGIKYP